MNNRFIIFVCAALTVLIPLFFSTLTPNFISSPKEILLTLGILAILAISLVQLLLHKKINLPTLSFSLPLLFFIAAIIASLIFNPEGRPEALGSRGLSLILLPLLAIFLSGNLTVSLRTLFVNLFIASTSLLAIHSLLSLTFLHTSPYLPSFMQNISFTPTGNYTTTLVLILIAVALSIAHLKSSAARYKPFLAGSLIIHTIAAVAIVSLMLPGSALAPSLIPYTASWSIALDALKSLRSLLFGIGLSNYSLLYSAVKPISLNITPFWNTLPTTATSELLTLLPTSGVIATTTLLYLIFKSLLRSFSTPLFLPTIIISLSLILLPATLPLYFTFFLFYSLTSSELSSTHHLSPLVSQILAGCFGILILLVGYFAIRSYGSEYYMRRAQLALDSNDSQRVYDLHLKAIQLSPNISNYHLSFAEINFRLASALSQKESLTDSDRDTITRLIQQSIQSGKTAIELRPNDSRTWLTVAKIYQNLINIADGADSFAEQTFARALSLDRANPLLHLEYAILLSQLANNQKDPAQAGPIFNRAIASIQTAIQLKPDYANAYYNLAKLYETTKDYPRALSAMQESLKRLDNSSSDYLQALTEIENLKLKLPKPSPQPIASPSPQPTPATSELSTPSPLPSPIDGGLIQLPAEE